MSSGYDATIVEPGVLPRTTIPTHDHPRAQASPAAQLTLVAQPTPVAW